MSSPAPKKLGVFDFETTGTCVETDRIVTAFVGTLDASGAVLDGQEWMIRPDGYAISDGAAAIHGITTDRAIAEGRPFAEVLPEIVEALAALSRIGIPVVAHNASYDFTMLAHEMSRAGFIDPPSLIDPIDIIDTFVLDKQVDKYRRGSRTLTATAAVYGVELSDEEAHGAQADAIAAGRIALVILSRPDFDNMSWDKLQQLQKGWAREQRASLQAYKRSKGDAGFTVELDWPLYASALALRAPEEVYTF